MGFPGEIKEQALIACKRHCVLCEKSKGKNIECHHIISKSRGGEDSFDNCIPLCFDCHEEVGSYNSDHPKGNKYTPNELKTRRNNFYNRVANGEFPKNQTSNTYSINSLDKKLFEKIQAIFNEPNLYYYLVELDLGNDFNNKVFEPLTILLFERNNPDYEFVDEKINSAMKELFQSIENFVDFKAINTAPTNLSTQALTSWKNEDFTYEQHRELSMQFNELATEIWNKYKFLNRLCRVSLY